MRREILADGIECWLGDCREILPTLGKVDCVVTDPPYGIGASSMSLGKWGASKIEKADWDNAVIDLAFLPDVPSIIWGGNYFELPPSRCYLVWDKGAGFRGRDFAECEMAWCSLDANARVLTYDPLARGDYRGKVHKTQKPVSVMEWCIKFMPDTLQVCDPFMGSGSTGCAAVKLGRKFIGIEINETYFDIAVRRIEDALRRPDLFIPAPPPKPKQDAMPGLLGDDVKPRKGR